MSEKTFELEVNASKKYAITITDGFELFTEKVLPFIVGDNVAVITDDNVNNLYGNVLDPFLKGKRVFKTVIKHGERSKNAANYLKIINALAENGFTREDTVVAFGGGMIGDLAGFAASTFMRGITLIGIPTTLLSMVDSSVGGKTAIDLAAGKNLCGTFYQPSAVYINTAFLDTLPKKEVKSGLGEVIKYAFLSDTVTTADIRRKDGKLIYECLKIKRDIVNEDETEKGVRALLNLGHTVGHAIEKLSRYKLSHGLCVAKGLKYSVGVSQTLYGFSEETADKMHKLLKTCKHDLTNPFTVREIIDAIRADKKRKKDSVDFVAVKDIGKAETVKISLSELKTMLENYERKNHSV